MVTFFSIIFYLRLSRDTNGRVRFQYLITKLSLKMPCKSYWNVLPAKVTSQHLQGLWHSSLFPEIRGTGRISEENHWTGCCLRWGMRAVAWSPWDGIGQHQMAPKVALPDLEGCLQMAASVLQQCPCSFQPLSHPPATLLTLGVMPWRPGPAVPWLALIMAHALWLEPWWWHWDFRLCLQSLSRHSHCCSCALVQKLLETSGELVQGCPHRIPLTTRIRQRLKVSLPWLSWGRGGALAAVRWLRLTCSLLLSVRALNHFVLFHPITWIHFKLWNSPFLPWLICEICHLPSWFALYPS